MDESDLKRFSDRAESFEFREEMRKQVSKNFKYILLALPCVFIFVLAVTLIVCKINGYEYSIAFATDAFVLVVLLVILAVNFVKYKKNTGRLKTRSLEGMVIKKEKYVTDIEGKKTRTKYKIVIQLSDGSKQKLKNEKARPYYSLVEKGDKVCYHPGFVYPIELFDKSKFNKNICVFCGKENDANADVCSICKKQMLI